MEKNEKEFLDKTYDMFRKHWIETNNAEESWERTKRLLHWYRIGLKDGVTEQRKRDIDKACKEFMRFLNARVDNPNYQLRKEDFSSWVEDFRKAMEGE